MVFRGKNTIICSSDVILNPINEGMPQMVADIKERDFNTSSEYFEGAAEFLRS